MQRPKWACGAGFGRQAVRPVTGRFRLIGRLWLTGQPPRRSGLDRLGGLLATQETLRLLRLDRSRFVTLLSFALGVKIGSLRLCPLRVGRLSGDSEHVPQAGLQPNQTGV